MNEALNRHVTEFYNSVSQAQSESRFGGQSRKLKWYLNASRAWCIAEGATEFRRIETSRQVPHEFTARGSVASARNCRRSRNRQSGEPSRKRNRSLEAESSACGLERLSRFLPIFIRCEEFSRIGRQSAIKRCLENAHPPRHRYSDDVTCNDIAVALAQSTMIANDRKFRIGFVR